MANRGGDLGNTAVLQNLDQFCVEMIQKLLLEQGCWGINLEVDSR